MQTKTFLETLSKHPDKTLIFNLAGKPISPGYHVTEVKALSIHSMDCGGQGNQWQETILQLWVPASKSNQGFMSVEKFLSIYKRVVARIPVQDEATLRVEYGDVGMPALNYIVTDIEVSQQIIVHVEAPAVACKGADRSVGDIPMLNMVQTTCCEPQPSNGSCCV